MAFRTLPTSRPCRASSVRVQATAQPRVAVRSAGRRQGVPVGLGAALLLQQVQPAFADDAAVAVQPSGADPVDQFVTLATDAVKSAGVTARSALDVLQSGLKVVKDGYDVAAPVIKQGVDAVSPVVQEAVKVTKEKAGPVLEQAVPVVKSNITSALQATGVDLNAVSSTTSAAAQKVTDSAVAASPFAFRAFYWLTHQDPTTLAQYGLGLVALYYLAPPLLGVAFGSLRGYSGELTAAAALDTINNDGNSILIDVRTEKEKESSGLPDVSGSASGKVVDVEFAFTEDRKLRGQLRNAGAIEAQVTALQIAALKRINRGTRVILLDRYGSSAKDVAKELARRGFGKVFVVSGGFDGRGGWVQSKLLVKPTANMYSSASGPIGTKLRLGTQPSSGGRKALPAPR